MELAEIGKDVFAALQEDRGWGWNNAGFVSSSRSLMIDTFLDVRRTRQALELFYSRASKCPQQLVNTHHNIDHCWGNQLFRDKEIIAHHLCAQGMQKDFQPSEIEAMINQSNMPPGQRWFADDLSDFDFSEVTPTLPNRLIDNDVELDLGEIRVEVIYLGPAHTAGDVVVHVPDKRIVFAGDLIFRMCTPIGWEGTTQNWVSALERIVQLEPEAIVPGHGPLCGIEGALEMIEYIQYVYDESARYFQQHLSAEEAAKRIELGPYADWTQPERLAFNVDRAYRELRGGAWDESVDFRHLLESSYALGQHLRARQFIKD